jgi:hypothetical protein
LAWLWLRVCKIIQNVTKSSKFVIIRFEVEFTSFFSWLFTLKNLLMIIYGLKDMKMFKNRENFRIFPKKTRKMVGAGAKAGLEPDPKFLKRWSRSQSRTKIDLLRNTDSNFPKIKVKELLKNNVSQENCFDSTRLHSTTLWFME